MKEAVILKHQLPGTQVPPDIRVGHAASGQGEQTESKNDHKNPSSRKQLNHFVDSWWHFGRLQICLVL